MAETENKFKSPKSRVIETENLLVRGHLLRWSDTVLQISNVSLVSTADLPFPRFPILSAVITIVGTVMGADEYSSWQGMGVLLAMAGIAWMVWWGVQCHDIYGKKYLNISLNSGLTYSLYFANQDFMRQVLQLLANIIETGTTPRTDFHISVKDCEIRDHGSLVQVRDEAGW